MSNLESLPAQETGYAKKHGEQLVDLDLLDAQIAAAGTAGAIAVESQVDTAA